MQIEFVLCYDDNYDETYENVHVIYDKDNITETLGEVLEKPGKNKLNCRNGEISARNLFLFWRKRRTFLGETRILKNYQSSYTLRFTT